MEFAVVVLLLLAHGSAVTGVILTPPYFNLAEGRRIQATATCGVGTPEPELYCKLVGANADRDSDINLIQGQVCDKCDPNSEDKRHPPEYAIDGLETWWQSPPLSRGMIYNEVNLTIDLGQEFHVAYVFIKMANSPRPGVWVLERSLDNGKTYQPWQYFADTQADCEAYFGHETLQPILQDDSVICETEYSKVVPLEGGEIVVSLLNDRPSANDFFNSTVLQEWTRATNIQLRFVRTKTLLGHLMSVARQDPTVTRRYFYSIKDISIGGRCVCNGHADTCNVASPDDRYKLVCQCQHNTCGDNCDSCCPGFEQKAWRLSKHFQPFICEPCNCFGHSRECVYDPKVDEQRLSLDIHGNYEGGGVCQNCRDNTEGVNCNRCKAGYFRPLGKQWNDTDVCQLCDCEFFYSTGNCAEGTGQCECRQEFTPPNCDSCSFGYFGYPECRPCECHLNGTRGFQCEAEGGQCPCKPNYSGTFCNKCGEGYYYFPNCSDCGCNPQGSTSDVCNVETGQCSCQNNYGGRTCDECQDGYARYPLCDYCNCDVRGTLPGVCNKTTAQCLCKEGYGGERCDQCVSGYFGYPNCKPCNCSEVGSSSTSCDASGKCSCLPNFSSRTCDQCSPGYYLYPECLACNCQPHGSVGLSCGGDGKCQCKDNFDGDRCHKCKEGFYNFPICEECNCDPAGVVEAFQGCGSVAEGELCKCKDRVQGRICNECRPLYWNLQPSNPEGCEECQCHLPGVVGGMGVCDTKNGQCICKPSVMSRRCDECHDGTYNLQEQNLFGCINCGCDIGGSVSNICDKESGQCPCRPRVTGQSCQEPLQAHYFPTLFHYQYEAEDGYTPARTPVRYGFDDSVFSNYSWKGYAVFSLLQNEIIRDVYIYKPSLYRMVLSFINPQQESIIGEIVITPDNPNDIEQKFQVLFKPTNKTPSFVTVAGPGGNIPSPFVMNPGRWSISIKNEKILFLDYFVLLPAAFYEATILVDKIEAPCEVGNKRLCRHFRYPDLSKFDMVRGEGGFLSDISSREPLREYYRNEEQLSELNKNEMPLINVNQNEIHFELTITRPGPHILIINYLTPTSDRRTAVVNVETSSQRVREKGRVTLYACPYTELCRQAVTDRHGQVAVFNFDANIISLLLKGEDNSNIALDSVVAIPYEEWTLAYQQPKPACVRIEGKCLSANFPTPPNSKKVEFKTGNELRVPSELPISLQNKTGLVKLTPDDSMIDISGKVPNPGYYVFVVHYYQPDSPEFDTNVIVHNGQHYEAKLELQHCPSSSGCRAIVKQTNGDTNFQLTENFIFTLKEPNGKGLWLDYLLVVPSERYSEEVLQEEPVDHTRQFITECGKKHFFMDTNEEGFCRDAVFSLTVDYNDGALPCQCDFEGSLSFECEKYGGQCKCRENVIGRKCEACKTGYFGFPNCRPCNCPSTALCETYTGECICPPRVTGERCDQCTPYTYGFDPIIGCEECNCNPLGVERGNLQCNLLNGSCECKINVVGRTCDRCHAGHWGFPYCETCDCDLRGTTYNICDQNSAVCTCKLNVYGEACDLCKEGTFNLQASNSEGCTKCFCSGKTTRCSSSSLSRAQVSNVEDWQLVSITINKQVSVQLLTTPPSHLTDSIGADLTLSETRDKVVYFLPSIEYLGNKLTAYGGSLNYTIYYTTHPQGSGTAVGEPDVILHSGDIFLLHSALEQPPATVMYAAHVHIVESNFYVPSGLPATRENLMQVLTNLEGIYIRATYWNDSVTTRLQNITLDVAVESYNPFLEKAVAVEQCLCPPNYKGLSCENCAPGYYRAQTGPFGGFCIPCQCNGHSDKCDSVTGICFDCKNNTVGDHCELCDVGYYGNATYGTQVDCMICACPLPTSSNNFATGCEVSLDGEEIRCDCIAGYYGPRCEVCAAGYYGQPQIQGEMCQKCTCSGNIDPHDPGSCDSVTGECLRCMNNTYGEACSLCAPGFYGDAVSLKNCQSCVCDKCGTQECNSYTGICQCRDNVVGDKCDRCELEHYGFSSCQGCLPCECKEAAESNRCDDNTGQCRCRPGVTGRSCDRCVPGFWNYGLNGCVSCGCNENYSVGVGCNATTGQCHCLPGVIGEKCDHCPYRWVLIENEGCFECDNCIHSLLDVTDHLTTDIDPIVEEFKTVARGYFTTQRLVYINNTANKLAPGVKLLDPQRINLIPLTQEVESLEMDSRSLLRKANYSVDHTESWAPKANRVHKDALEVEEFIHNAVAEANNVVGEVSQLSFNLEAGASPEVDFALQEAQDILQEIQQRDFGNQRRLTDVELMKATELHNNMKAFSIPPHNMSQAFEALRKKINEFDDKLDDLHNQTSHARNTADAAEDFNERNRNSKVLSNVDTVKNMTKETSKILDNAKELLKNASDHLAGARNDFNSLDIGKQEDRQLQNLVRQLIEKMNNELNEVREPIREAQKHAEELSLRADELDELLAESRYTSEHAVGAANAYKNIVDAINEALLAANDAQGPAENATSMSEGLGDRTGQSEVRSSELLNEAQTALYGAQQKLGPQLADAKESVALVKKMNEHSDQLDQEINEALTNIPTNTYEFGRQKAMEDAGVAGVTAEDASSRIVEIVDKLPTEVDKSRQLPRVVEDSKNIIAQADQQISRLTEVVPNINNLAKTVKEKQGLMQASTEQFRTQLEELRKHVARARELADRIRVGVTFHSNTTLQLKNPESLSQLGTALHASIYFRTREPNGFLFYLGNEVDTYHKLRRTQTDDFIALEIENGQPVLTVDLGSGPQKIISDKKVDDYIWYQAVIDRTGKIITLTINEEGSNGQQISHVVSGILQGPKSVLNLDQEHSKLFVGGYPATFKMQDSVSYQSFAGEMEELVIGNIPVSLWNFVDAENNEDGAVERSQLVNLQPSTGYRFNGEKSYVKVDGKQFPMRTQGDLQLNFKTFAKDGVLFLVVGKGRIFLSVELRDGKVAYQFDLGDGLFNVVSSQLYNDGKWHTVNAVRQGKTGVLSVDGSNVGEGDAPDGAKDLRISPLLYFGGHPKHRKSEVTRSSFDGCIDQVQIDGTVVDLSQNLEAFGVTPGCPVQVASLVSFDEHNHGYLVWPNASARNSFEFNFKFRTTSEKGLIMYATDRDQQNTVSLSLVGGRLVMRSQLEEQTTKQGAKYNDNEWHVVTGAHTSSALSLDIDDFETFMTDSAPPPLFMLYGKIYFGGVPENYNLSQIAAASSSPFSGCLADATVNGIFINFANATDRIGARLGKCPLATPEVLLPVTPTADFTEEPYPEEVEPVDEDLGIKRPVVVPRTEMPIPPITEAATTPSTTTTTMATTTAIITTTTEKPVDACQLPLVPAHDPDITPDSGVRFGMLPDSLIELNDSMREFKLKNKYDFSIDFRTYALKGVLFYVEDKKRIDFIALYLQDGKVMYGFNCGTGSALIQGTKQYNDGLWHNAEFKRTQTRGTLLIDGNLEGEGDSRGSAKSINVEPPFLLGGLKRTMDFKTKENLMGINETFVGCLRNFMVNKNLISLSTLDGSHGVAPCSEKDERGAFFGAEGSYIKARPRFRVGEQMNIEMFIKPRNISGILLSVHGRRDFLLLQMVDGNIRFSVDNGKGIITTKFNPPHPHYFCDGQWHEIKAFKAKNVVTLSVDKQGVPAGIGIPGSSSTDTSNPLFIGGHAPMRKALRGVVMDRIQYIGCIRDIVINNQPEPINLSQVRGNVTLDFCPTI